MNNVKKPFVRLALTAAILALAACGGGEGRQEKYLESAKTYIDQDNIEKAKIELKNVLQINPNNAQARFLLGEIDEKAQNWRGAYGNFSAAVEADPKHIAANIKLALLLFAARDLEESEAKAKVVLELDPNSADALAVLAGIALAREEQDKAIELAQKAMSVEPGHVHATTLLTQIYSKDNPELALQLIGDSIAKQSKNESLKLLKVGLLRQQGDSAGVIALLNELRAEHPDQLFYDLQLVNFLLSDEKGGAEDERKDKAEQTLSEIIAQKPDNTTVKLWMVEFLEKNREQSAGIEKLESYVAAQPDEFALRDALGRQYVGRKDFDKAIAVYQAPIDKAPESADAITARNRLVVIAKLQEDRPRVEALLTEIFKLDAENPDALIERARLAAVDKNLTAAIADLRVVVKGDPENKMALDMLGSAHELQGESSLALDYYQQLLALGMEPMVAVRASRILVKEERVDDAEKILELAYQQAPLNPDVVTALTEVYVRKQMWTEALEAAGKLVANENAMVAAIGNYLQGRVYLRKNEYQNAVTSLEQSLAASPDIIEALTALVSGYMALEQSDKAIAYVEKHLEANPSHVHARETLGSLYASAQNWPKAESLLKSVIEEQPQRLSGYQLLARIYLAQGKTAETEALYKQGIGHEGEQRAGLQLMLSELYQATSRYQEAVDLYEEMLKNDPENIVVKNNLASLLLDHFMSDANLQRAKKLATDLAASQNPAFLDTAGWVEYQLGNYPQAVSLLQAAVSAGGTAPVFRYHLGMAYFKSDMKPQAKQELELALENEKTVFPGVDEAKQTLSTL